MYNESCNYIYRTLSIYHVFHIQRFCSRIYDLKRDSQYFDQALTEGLFNESFKNVGAHLNSRNISTRIRMIYYCL